MTKLIFGIEAMTCMDRYLTYRNRKLTFVTSIDVGGTFNSTVSSIIELSVLAFYV